MLAGVRVWCVNPRVRSPLGEYVVSCRSPGLDLEFAVRRSCSEDFADAWAHLVYLLVCDGERVFQGWMEAYTPVDSVGGVVDTYEGFFFFEAWRSPAEETQNIAPMRGSPTDSRICTKRSLNLPKVLTTFITETMGYKQAFLNLQYVDLVNGNVVLCRMVIEIVSVRGKKQLSVILAIIGGQRR